MTMGKKRKLWRPRAKGPRKWKAPAAGKSSLDLYQRSVRVTVQALVDLLAKEAGVPEGVRVGFDGEQFTEITEPPQGE